MNRRLRIGTAAVLAIAGCAAGATRGGRHEAHAVPASATTIQTTVFGQPAYGDLQGDGSKDAVLLLVQQPGDSGTFYSSRSI